MKKTIWDTVYEMYGAEMNLTKEQVDAMEICELEQIIYADEAWDEERGCWINTKTGEKIEQ